MVQRNLGRENKKDGRALLKTTMSDLGMFWNPWKKSDYICVFVNYSLDQIFKLNYLKTLKTIVYGFPHNPQVNRSCEAFCKLKCYKVKKQTNLEHTFLTHVQNWDDSETHRQGGALALEAEMLASGRRRPRPGHSAAPRCPRPLQGLAANQMLTVIFAFHLSSLKHTFFSYFFGPQKQVGRQGFRKSKLVSSGLLKSEGHCISIEFGNLPFFFLILKSVIFRFSLAFY